MQQLRQPEIKIIGIAPTTEIGAVDVFRQVGAATK
jgi:hypothetical protein